MILIQSVAAHIHPSIRLTIDYPSNYPDGKIPMLDVKMWIEEGESGQKIMYEHYEKEMATKAVINAKSAISMKTKRTILAQEMLRILLHCSKYLPWETVCTHVNKFMNKLQYSGYKQSFRYNVVRSGMNAYKVIKQSETMGIRPMNRPKGWKGGKTKEERGQEENMVQGRRVQLSLIRTINAG